MRGAGGMSKDSVHIEKDDPGWDCKLVRVYIVCAASSLPCTRKEMGKKEEKDGIQARWASAFLLRTSGAYRSTQRRQRALFSSFTLP
jgi:hypothetical protein